MTTPSTLGTVLITGGCGFLGSHIVRLLLERSSASTINSKTYSTTASAIHVLDLRITNQISGVRYHTGDLTSPSSVAAVLNAVNPDIVIHTASPVWTSGTAKSLDIMRRVNVDGTRILIDVCRAARVKALVHTSSASVISDTRTDLINADERWLVVRGRMQHEYYSETKAEAEELVLAANARPPVEGALLTTALRPSLLFGEGDAQLIPGLLGAYERGQTGWQFGENENLFDFTYVGNVAHAHLLAAVRLRETWEGVVGGSDGRKGNGKKVQVGGGSQPQEVEDKIDGEAFLITNGAPVYFWDFTRAVWQAYHAQLRSASPLKTPTPANRVTKISFGLAITLATLLGWVYWVLRLGTPKIDVARVRFSCMTRFFRIAKAQSLLGYAPIWELSEGVERTGRWWAARREEEEEQDEGKKQN